MKEFPAPDEVLRPRDHLTVWVPAATWHCVFCQPQGGDGAGTTVDWLIGEHDGPDGRCRVCGAKFKLARPFEAVPTVLEQQQRQASE